VCCGEAAKSIASQALGTIHRFMLKEARKPIWLYLEEN
jgi:hypothetical protein